MAALEPSRTRQSRPPLAVGRRAIAPVRPLDGAVDLALRLAILRERHDLRVVAVSTVDGVVLASCGDADAARALAAFAQLVLGRARRDVARTMHLGKMHLERVDLLGQPCVVAAMANAILEEPGAIADALRDLYGDVVAEVEEESVDAEWAFEADFSG